MQLNPKEEALVEAFRRMPPRVAEELSALAERLASLAPDTKIDWSDAWSDTDLQDFTTAAARRADLDEQAARLVPVTS
jgi:hypothetical protein